MTGRLEGKVALVSGAAQGMGAAHARAVVREGGQVVIGDILDDLGKLLADELGENAAFVHLDVTSEDDWANAVATAVSTFGKLNVLVNNAGIVNFGFLENYSVAQWNTILNVNLTGSFIGIKTARDELFGRPRHRSSTSRPRRVSPAARVSTVTRPPSSRCVV